MFDIFYLTKKPNLFVNERHAESIQQAQAMSNTRYFWIVDYLCDYSDWDFLWEPPPWEKDFIHAFASQHQPDSKTYLVPKKEFSGTKYNNMIIRRLPANSNWSNTENFTDFDYSWHPDPVESPYIYHFPTQHQRAGGPVYTVPGATEVKYVQDLQVQKTTTDDYWNNKEFDNFDYTWHPDPTDPPYIYQFGTQHQKTGGPRYEMSGASEVKYVDTHVVRKTSVDNNWDDLSYEFDYTWHPDATDRPYIYQFGTQHQKTGGPRYTVPGATEVKYVKQPCTVKKSVDNNWDDLSYEFDYTWHPDATDAPYIYQFGTQHQKTGGPRYTVPGATEVKYVRTIHATKSEIDDSVWQIPDDVDVSDFDFTWHPDATDAPYIYQFGTQWQKTGGPRYVMPGATEVKYIRTIKCKQIGINDYWQSPEDIVDFDYTWHPDSTNEPYIYQFGTQWQKTGGPRYVMPGATTTKYIHTPRCEKTSVDSNWQIPSNVQFDDFDYTWHPDATDTPYIYQFGTQHQKTGGPRYVVNNAVDVKYVDQIRIKAEKFASGAIVINHFDGNSETVKQQVEKSIDVLRVARYFDNYKDTLKRVLSTLDDQEFVWIVSSVCDYSDFDFTWHPEVWQIGMLHVFASNEQKFGDTFFVHIPTFLDKIDDVELLEWYDCNYVEEISVPRPIKHIKYNDDNLLDAVKNLNFPGPEVYFTKQSKESKCPATTNLWRNKTKAVVSLSKDNSCALVPRECKASLKTQMYDYPFVDKSQNHFLPSELMDIVYISYDEPDADANWKTLQEITTNLPNRVTRVHGVAGMENALKAAAEESKTPWVYNVFAKTELASSFKFNFVPDYFMKPKHYIFHCKNLSNGLEYGHMGVVLYNADMVINAPPYEKLGLDYTVSFPVEVVPELSCYGRFATSPYHAWRTAFRECAKLGYFNSLENNMENTYRLDVWTTHAEGEHADWVLAGARDGLEFFKESNSNLDYLKSSFRWEWLRERFVKKYGDLV